MIDWYTAIDLDGTVINLCREWLRAYNRDYNDNLVPSQIKDWNIHKFVKPTCGKRIYEYLENPALYNEASIIRGARKAINDIRKFSKIMFVTDSTEGHKGRKLKWLEDKNLIMNGDEYIEIKNKSQIPALFLIDDYDVNIRNFSGYKGIGTGILFKQYWNAKYCNEFPTCFDGWARIPEYIKSWSPVALKTVEYHV